MAESYSELGLFKGTNTDECEGFVATVRRRALEQGKHRDNEWMAVFASSYLGGEALYWYEDLEESIQNDWSQLRPALLAKFGGRGKTPSASSSVPIISSSTSSTTIPTPAAAPPSTNSSSLVRKGRLRVINSVGTLVGYIAKSADSIGLYEALSSDPAGALLVSFTASVIGPFDIQIIDTSQNPNVVDVLAVVWTHLTGSEWMKNSDYVASCCSFSSVSPKRSWAFQQNVWALSEDGGLSVEYPKPGGTGIERLQPFVRRSDALLHWMRPYAAATRSYDAFRIVVEDAI
ncbi:hypothetical protein M407DRAFT_19084 [Tulasnella calospora MUT 4182]|uniref:Retrotransposon gag domain-containing protein n=1 Tax=Tulasnella calospora MUT 4182 TaxID=1051891 RepID=A0A0C3QIU2_9AGAM|nr:hypothetical protein M407DRAFT_19084 [Tulasnella calospora MUT 4182]